MVNILGGRAGQLWAPFCRDLSQAYAKGLEVIVLVPEQFTLQAERNALETLRVKGFFRLQVLSPSRFSKRVFSFAGHDPRVVIDERGKLMTMARAMQAAKDDLLFYKGSREKPGFARKLTEAVSELKGAGISPEALAQFALEREEDSPKLRDLSRLYMQYEALLRGKLLDREDKERDLLQRFSQSSLFSGAVFLVYGFDLLSEPLLRLLTAIAGKASDLFIYMVMERGEYKDGKAFEPVYDSVTRLFGRLEAAGLAWTLKWLPKEKQGRPPALAHLEGHLMRVETLPFSGPPEGLTLYAGKTPHEEVRRAAQLVFMELGRGTDPQDIAVFIGGEAGYADLVSSVFRDYRIPFYLAHKQPILAHPLLRCVFDAFHCIQNAAWRQEDVLSYAKSAFSPITKDEGWALENWALRYGVSRSAWTRPFTRGEENERAQYEKIRLKAILPVMALRDSLVKARSATESICGVIAFLDSIGAYERIMAFEQELVLAGQPDEAIRTRQVWDKLSGMLSQMHELMGGDRIPLGQFPDWLQAGLSVTELSALPPQERCVQVGALGQLMPHEPKVVFALGLNAGCLTDSEETLLNDLERGKIQEASNTRMSLPRNEKDVLRALDLYKALAAAGERLYLSYALSDEGGSPLGPLPQLTRVKQLFPEIIEEGGAVGVLREPQPLAPAPALDEIALLLQLGQMRGPWLDAWAWLRQSPAWGGMAEAVRKAALGDDPHKQLDGEQAGRLFDTRAVSVSRLESYAGCPFRHFVEYGLRPKKRPEWAVDRTDFGSFCHAAMEGFTSRVIKNPVWPNLTPDEVKREMEPVLLDLTRDWADQPWADTPRARKNAQTYLDICSRMAWALTEGSQKSGFRPRWAELKFGLGEGLPPLEIAFEEGGGVTLRGTIDRVDIALDSGLRFLRVVDYKTGKTSLNASDIDAGVQLQLLLYMKAALTLLSGTEPAGAFYQLMDDPLVKADTAQEAQKKARDKLRLDGVILKDKRVVQLMDGGEPPTTLINLISRDGSLKDKDRLLSREELERLICLAEDRAREVARQIFSGLISRKPLLRTSGRAECQWCDYAGVCRMDKISREKSIRRANKTGFKQLIEQNQYSSGDLAAGKRRDAML